MSRTIKFSEFTLDQSLQGNNLFPFIDTDNKLTPLSSIELATWSLSANYGIDKIQNTYTTVNSNSAVNWSYQGTDVKALTSNWQNTYTTVNSNSALWGNVPSALTYSSTIVPNYNDGWYRKVTMTGNVTLSSPSNGTDGSRWKCRFLASGANRDLVFNSSIKIPIDSTFTGTKTISSNYTYLVQLEKMNSSWVLETLIGGWNI